MKYITLDGIVRSLLNQKQLPIHYYMRFLKYAADGYRELHFDSLKNIRAVKLPLTDYKAVQLPCDFVDLLKVGVATGQYVQPFVMRNGINRLNNLDASGNPTTYGSPTQSTSDYAAFGGWDWFTNHFNDYGEATGRYFGLGVGSQRDTFKLIPERNEIQFSEDIQATEVILEYIGDGTCCDSATSIHPYAQKAIEAYADWMYKKHSKSFGLGDEQVAEREFVNQNRKLRARLNGMTMEDIRRSVDSGYLASVKI